jgi:hypothetical protein
MAATASFVIVQQGLLESVAETIWGNNNTWDFPIQLL